MTHILEIPGSNAPSKLEKFSCFSIRNSIHSDKVAGILQAALQAVDPGQAVRRHLQRSGHFLTIANRSYDLNNYGRVRLVSVGKAAEPMAEAVISILGSRLDSGFVLTKTGHLTNQIRAANVTWLEAGHPIPDRSSLEGAQNLAQFLSGGQPDDLIIALISGGSSALMIDPAPDISLEDLQKLTAQLLAAGANIQQINALRKHLDLIKGGGLARRAAPASLIALILSDVVGDPLDVIASGPTVPDPTTFENAFEVLQLFNLTESVPAAILDRIQRGRHGEFPETPKPGSEIFTKVQNILVGSNYQAAQAAADAAEWAGMHSQVLTTHLEGEASQAGRILSGLLRQVTETNQPLPRPACLILGGETTVTIQTQQSPATRVGLGGRNQELALASVEWLAGLKDILFITLATDGGDGPTDAAGAAVTGDTLRRASQLGLDPKRYLANHDSYRFFEALDDLIKTGPTRTNVNDLTFLFAL